MGVIVRAPSAMSWNVGRREQVIKQSALGEKCIGTESTPLLTTSGTANLEVINFINIDVRNSTQLPRLAQIGQAFSKFRVNKMTAAYTPEIASNISGAIAMALIYDSADVVAANWSIQRILATDKAVKSSLWTKSPPIKYDNRLAAKPWYISGTTTGVGAQNEQTPVTIVYGYYSNTVNIPSGRIDVHYEVELVQPISPQANT